jgi:hypothetical protein
MARPPPPRPPINKPTLPAAALLHAAGGETTIDPAEKFREALPKVEAVEVATYQSEASPTATAAPGAAVAKGDSGILQSEYAVMSHRLALTMNLGVAWSLGLVRLIVAHPATVCEADVSCTWGPWVDDDGLNRWQLHVEKVGDAYVYALSAQPGSGPGAAFTSRRAGTWRCSTISRRGSARTCPPARASTRWTSGAPPRTRSS